MEKIYQFIKSHPLYCLTTITIWILCFIDIPETPLDQVSFIDKWTHAVMYLGLCGVFWTEHLFINRDKWNQPKEKKQLLIFGFIWPALMGGLIEILQANCTGGRRSGDWLDFYADFIGVLLGQITGILLAKYLSKQKKDS